MKTTKILSNITRFTRFPVDITSLPCERIGKAPGAGLLIPNFTGKPNSELPMIQDPRGQHFMVFPYGPRHGFIWKYHMAILSKYFSILIITILTPERRSSQGGEIIVRKLAQAIGFGTWMFATVLFLRIKYVLSNSGDNFVILPPENQTMGFLEKTIGFLCILLGSIQRVLGRGPRGVKVNFCCCFLP